MQRTVKFNYADSPKPVIGPDGFVRVRSALRMTLQPRSAHVINTKVTADKPVLNIDNGTITPAGREIYVNIEVQNDPRLIEIGEPIGRFVVLDNYDLVIE